MIEELPSDGPTLEVLTRRLAECPPDFLLEPRIQGKGLIEVPAVVSDLFRYYGEDPLSAGEAELLRPLGPQDGNRARLTMVVCWLFFDPWFLARKELAQKIYALMAYNLSELARLVEASLFVTDDERREELVRYCLSAIGLRFRGETPDQAQDRLTTLSSVYREQVLQESRVVQERVRRIREELERKAAQEAAAKVTRE